MLIIKKAQNLVAEHIDARLFFMLLKSVKIYYKTGEFYSHQQQRVPTFLVPIINPAFADNNRHLYTKRDFFSGTIWGPQHAKTDQICLLTPVLAWFRLATVINLIQRR